MKSENRKTSRRFCIAAVGALVLTSVDVLAGDNVCVTNMTKSEAKILFNGLEVSIKADNDFHCRAVWVDGKSYSIGIAKMSAPLSVINKGRGKWSFTQRNGQEFKQSCYDGYCLSENTNRGKFGEHAVDSDGNLQISFTTQ